MSQQINLFNPIFRQQKKYFSAATMAQALGLILGGALLVAAYANYQSANLRRQAAAAATQLAQTQEQLAKVNAQYAVPQKSKSLEDEIRRKEAEVKGMQQVFDTLQKGEFGNTNGYSEYLRSFSRQIADGIWLTGFSIYGAGNEIGLQGRTLRPELVPAYINRLKNEPVMQGKSFAALEMRTPPEQPDRGDPPGDKPRSLPPYLEFSLQSSGIVSEQKLQQPRVKNQ